jgi:hypothetical protein
VYLEGARDRDVVEGWARGRSPQLARRLRSSAVILGGRQPARAEAHLARQRAEQPKLRGLCILDADDGMDSMFHPSQQSGLEVVTWSRRHVESYLLVPDAIRRALRLRDDQGLAHLLRELLPDPDDEGSLRLLDAKRLLGPGGPIARSMDRSVPLGRIARVMREDELHPDVTSLLGRLERAFNLTGPDVVRIKNT